MLCFCRTMNDLVIFNLCKLGLVLNSAVWLMNWESQMLRSVKDATLYILQVLRLPLVLVGTTLLYRKESQTILKLCLQHFSWI